MKCPNCQYELDPNDDTLNKWETAIVERALDAYVRFEETNDLSESIAAKKVKDKLFPYFKGVARG